MRRQVPIILTAVVGILLVIAFFIPHEPFGTLGEDMTVFFDIVAVFAFILGGGNLIKIHGDKIYKRSKDWLFSIVTVVGFVSMLSVGLFKIGQTDWCGAVDRPAAWFDKMYLATFDPLMSTMYALLAFFVASASSCCIPAVFLMIVLASSAVMRPCAAEDLSITKVDTEGAFFVRKRLRNFSGARRRDSSANRFVLC